MAFHTETAVIGSLLLSPETLAIAQQRGVEPGDFESAECRRTYETIQTLHYDKRIIDVITVNAKLKDSGFDYTQFLLQCLDITPTANNIDEYCRLLKEDARHRKIEAVLTDASNEVYFGDWQVAAETAAQTLHDLTVSNNADILQGLPLADVFWRHFQQTKINPDYAYCKTGFPSLDNQLGGGMFRSEIYIVGARPGMGKTTFAVNVANRMARSNKPILFISLEMTAEQLVAKRIALETGIEYIRLLTGKLSDREEEQMTNCLKMYQEEKLFIVSKSGLTVRDIERYARQIDGLAAVVIDYMGLIAVDEDEAQKSRYEQMTAISGAIKNMAKRLDVPVMALSQLNRENTNRQDKRPQLSDLRDSGAIEQDAGSVILLHRPEYYTRKDPGAEETGPEDFEVIVAKNRHFLTGSIMMSWNGATGQIIDYYAPPSQPQKGDDLPF